MPKKKKIKKKVKNNKKVKIIKTKLKSVSKNK